MCFEVVIEFFIDILLITLRAHTYTEGNDSDSESFWLLHINDISGKTPQSFASNSFQIVRGT